MVFPSLFCFLFRWYDFSRETDPADKHLDALENIRHYFAHVVLDVRSGIIVLHACPMRTVSKRVSTV